MQRYFLRLLTLSSVVILLGLSSCDSLGNSASEGTVSYEITYPIPFEDKLMSSLMPSDMDVKFKDNLLKTELSFAMGMIRVAYLTDAKRKELYEMMKFMNNKSYAVRTAKEVELMISQIPEHQVTLGTGSKVIAGYNCKNANVTVKTDSTDTEYELWYTDEIGIPEVNWSTPFSEIKGVLMEYQVERYDIIMKFTATEVTLNTFDEDEFNVPEQYKRISFQEMEENMKQLKEI